jgi:hypothetical protein
MAQGNYAEHFHAVDRSDRESADYTASIHTNRWYTRVFFWTVDRVIYCLFVVVVFCAKDNVGPEWWALYLKKGGRYRFQIDLGMTLINYALENEWEDIEGPRPNWIRQREFIPCDCNNCFFCLKGLTNGIAHKKPRQTKTLFIQCNNSRTVQKGCTDKQVDLKRGCSYCRMCFRKSKGAVGADGKKMSAAMRKRKPYSNSARLGCPSCDEPICEKCWAKGYDMHAKKSA